MGSRARLKRVLRSARYRARQMSKVTDTPVQKFDSQATDPTRAAETFEISSKAAASSEVPLGPIMADGDLSRGALATAPKELS